MNEIIQLLVLTIAFILGFIAGFHICLTKIISKEEVNDDF